MQPFIRDRIPDGVGLDIGCGSSPYKKFNSRIIGVDIQDLKTDVFVDAEKGLPFKSSSFDFAILSESLEHMWSPVEVVAEIKRILKSGGIVLGTVPFMHPIHGTRDFWRPTDQGLRRIFKDSGFISIQIEPKYGYFCLISTLILYLPGVRSIPGAILFRRFMSKLDDWLGSNKTWVTGWNFIARIGFRVGYDGRIRH